VVIDGAHAKACDMRVVQRRGLKSIAIAVWYGRWRIASSMTSSSSIPTIIVEKISGSFLAG
jgi:hypothetical protein